jgi:uncharacterized protein (DUF362 family)
MSETNQIRQGISRRSFIAATAAAGVTAGSGIALWRSFRKSHLETAAFIAKINDYQADISKVILEGMRELEIGTAEIRGKRILLKPNLIETLSGVVHINTHPLMVRGAIEAFLKMGAASILVAEGPGHSRDALLVLEESGMADVLQEDRIPFVDLNYDDALVLPNQGRHTRLASFILPQTLAQVDWIVSMPKMKTHHWAGVTLSMKNLFGVVPGNYYGWPKNVLHFMGINRSIMDITATVRPHFTIVDGIVGMEGDGPIMGTPRHAGVIVMGRNLPAVDATCARIMGIDPMRIKYLAGANDILGPVTEDAIMQCGEKPSAVRSNFVLLDKIHAHQGLRLAP